MSMQSYVSAVENQYEGKPWYGSSILDILKGVDHMTASERIPGSKLTIGRLVAHIISWRYFVIEKLEENADFDIEMNTEEDWPEVIINDGDDWDGLLYDLEVSQHKLIAVLKSSQEKIQLEELVPGKDYKEYTYEYMLTGLLQHDAYHSGQIALIKKMMM